MRSLRRSPFITMYVERWGTEDGSHGHDRGLVSLALWIAPSITSATVAPQADAMNLEGLRRGNHPFLAKRYDLSFPFPRRFREDFGRGLVRLHRLAGTLRADSMAQWSMRAMVETFDTTSCKRDTDPFPEGSHPRGIHELVAVFVLRNILEPRSNVRSKERR